MFLNHTTPNTRSVSVTVQKEDLYSPSVASICFEIWGFVAPGKKNRFSRQISEKFRFFQVILHKKSIFPGKISTNFDFFRQFQKHFDFPCTNWSFIATAGQITDFSSKVTTFEHTSCTMISYNNISRPVHDLPYDPLRLHDPLPKISGVAIDAPDGRSLWHKIA